MQHKVNFFQLNELFLNLGGLNSPSELQGMLCGQLCGGREFSEREWQRETLEFMDLEEVQLDQEQATLVAQLYKVTLKLLEDMNFGFYPLLPGEESSMRRRTEELGDWCKGFLYGLGVSGLNGEAEIAPDVADALRDMAQISLVSADEEDEVEKNEVYWQELCEYVKVAVLTVYTELTHNKNDELSLSGRRDDDNQMVH